MPAQHVSNHRTRFDIVAGIANGCHVLSLPRQLKRAQALLAARPGGIKPVLTGGSYLDLMKRWNKPVFYDQDGTLVRKFGIAAVPAIVSQEGQRLRIDEVPLR